MVVRMRHTKGKRNRVRSHHALTLKALGRCAHCNAAISSHRVCPNCGHYKGREVVNVFARLDKKERKKKEKELHAHEEEEAAKGAPLNAEKLSHK
ncbi:MAG: 50S ribosomal protein L32 [Candidatus Sungbacteria bacterium RIFCSPLOWO2_02_FULL_51_17]|uniref:Large ribosomal subunit protein bL32 n=1 Tax=Candidatus Sungbacteria bacterium RIFCSPHIGHO2_02_FULL_51_29 TaxID=1802273 RepID=A0A1G2KQ39_9BACT|nr:MAG: 50S ribosomal protein L32 [Candidatus Sungbacteria bacterium RIFCSPHIGHO2_01_FULL_51_22]OHA01537.1 MAG: 50S ribosomal protein L32 [Candidatus Sungbacteria bacterium RIFCSPHIGHO2_02_FULL_51_29]OHA11809.1 MAG: 50S ribosomal protein L32 [Candidatus Sungbacteria bacterium RIFCSPLOWO2_02_FULL_51_17]